ncbi:hypothetical protein [Flavihumibacter solisilvae]|uniref:Uncharacterized protein n=1 Tax=Flavihumibacter solisilvae TaxID=1349421 RepID=A0A0C1LH62_9BACT|nr:hypothetical protein [Flavihumibacter solisilvae]KIC94648.1 hypothetical protein OI18_11215 [Flavihumibacter solisilvae]
MSKANDNVITRNMSGMFGDQVVFRKRGRNTIACKPPVFNKGLEPTANQQEARMSFRLAQAYAKKAIKDSLVKQAYQAVASPEQSAFNVAFSDAYLAPQILGIDTEAYKGLVQDTILVRALDDFKVTGVKVAIFSVDQELLEEGDAIETDNGIDWSYTVKTVNPSLTGTIIKTTAMDLPGNKTLLDKTL